MWGAGAECVGVSRALISRAEQASTTVSGRVNKHHIRQLLILQLMAASLLCQVSCGRLGYQEHTRTTSQPADAGPEPASDEDAGEP